MARWHLTLALSATAVAALLIAPRLTGLTPSGPAPDVVPPTPPPAPPALQTGVLHVEAGLDRTAVIGHGEERFLVISVGAPEDVGLSVDRPVDLAVVLDASGSMSDRGKIDYARQAAKLLASNMDREDRFSLVTFNDSARVSVPAVAVTDPSRLHAAIDGIYEAGGTNLYAGLELGADQVKNSLRPGMVGRVVVLSDGHANVGLTSPEAFEQLSTELAASGVAVSAIGLGRDYNEDLLARMADLGGGTYDYVDEPRELAEVLADELERTASVVARGVSVQVTLPPGVEPLDVLGWDATPSGNGWSVWLGDVYSGESRKIVTRVRVGALDEGQAQLASVRANYHDLVLDGPAVSETAAVATVTRDSRLAHGSVHRERTIASQRAWGAWHLDRSTRAWEQGNRNEAVQAARQGQQVLRQAAIDFEDSTLEADAEALMQIGYVVEREDVNSYEGKGALKAAKENYRALVR